MKVKIKGLVFVGFAAAILSANAMADDTNTVTSKSYVDAKYVGKANDYIDVSLNSQTQKNDVSIKAAKIADDATKVHAGDEKLTTAAGVKAYTNGGTNGALATFNSSGALTSTPIVKSTESATNWSNQNFEGSDDKVPSEKAVVDALDALQATVGRNELEDSTYIQSEFNQSSQKTTVLIDPDQIANTVALIDAGGTPLTTAGAVGAYVNVRGVKVNGSALTPDANKDVNVTVAEGTANGTIKVNGTDVPVHNAEVTTNKLKQNGAEGSVITDQATDDQYPSALAVYNALTDTDNVGNGTVTATQNGVTVGTFDLNQAGNGSITILKPDWDQATTTAADYIANKPTIQTAGNSIGAATNATSEQKNLPTSYAVKEYVQSQTGGTVIPAMDTTKCTATIPCALVAEASGAVHWRTMATATHAGGTCADATGDCQ